MTANHARSVLLVDADSEHRHFLKHEFMRAGWLVSEAEEQPEAIAHLRNHGTPTVVIDLDLTAKSREQFLDEIRAASPTTRIILLASYSVLDREEGYRIGATAVLSKPVDPSVLLERAEEILLPASKRWTHARASGQKDQKLALSIEDLIVGRGGFSLPNQVGQSLLEGQSVEFALEIARGKYSVHGHGTVRYVSLDSSRTKQLGWGIEIDNLDENSLKTIETKITSEKPESWIPRRHG